MKTIRNASTYASPNSDGVRIDMGQFEMTDLVGHESQRHLAEAIGAEMKRRCQLVAEQAVELAFARVDLQQKVARAVERALQELLEEKPRVSGNVCNVCPYCGAKAGTPDDWPGGELVCGNCHRRWTGVNPHATPNKTGDF